MLVDRGYTLKKAEQQQEKIQDWYLTFLARISFLLIIEAL